MVKWKDIKDAPPANLKTSPIVMIPHKSRKYRTILDLSCILNIGGSYLPLANDVISLLETCYTIADSGCNSWKVTLVSSVSYNGGFIANILSLGLLFQKLESTF